LSAATALFNRRLSAPTTARHEHVTAIVEREAIALLDYFLRRVESHEDAADLLGETLLVVWRRERSLPGDPVDARMWMFGIARKVLLTQRRTIRRRRALSDRLAFELASLPEPVDATMHDDLRQLLRTHLDEIDREIVRLVYWEGFSLVEVATVMSMRPSTVRSRHRRAHEKLRNALSH